MSPFSSAQAKWGTLHCSVMLLVLILYFFIIKMLPYFRYLLMLMFKYILRLNISLDLNIQAFTLIFPIFPKTVKRIWRHIHSIPSDIWSDNNIFLYLFSWSCRNTSYKLRKSVFDREIGKNILQGCHFSLTFYSNTHTHKYFILTIFRIQGKVVGNNEHVKSTLFKISTVLHCSLQCWPARRINEFNICILYV